MEFEQLKSMSDRSESKRYRLESRIHKTELIKRLSVSQEENSRPLVKPEDPFDLKINQLFKELDTLLESTKSENLTQKTTASQLEIKVERPEIKLEQLDAHSEPMETEKDQLKTINNRLKTKDKRSKSDSNRFEKKSNQERVNELTKMESDRLERPSHQMNEPLSTSDLLSQLKK